MKQMWLRWFAGAACVAAAGCHTPTPPGIEMLNKADEMCRGEYWIAGAETAKHYLLYHPDDAGGHFLLGRCYMSLKHLVLAEGEFETARHLFLESGRVNPIPRFESDPNSADYFEMMTYIEMAKVYFLQIHIMIELGASKDALYERLAKWQEVLDEARRINPASEDIVRGQELHDAMKDEIDSKLPGRGAGESSLAPLPT